MDRSAFINFVFKNYNKLIILGANVFNKDVEKK